MDTCSPSIVSAFTYGLVGVTRNGPERSRNGDPQYGWLEEQSRLAFPQGYSSVTHLPTYTPTNQTTYLPTCLPTYLLIYISVSNESRLPHTL